jgi:uncharacterized protein
MRNFFVMEKVNDFFKQWRSFLPFKSKESLDPHFLNPPSKRKEPFQICFEKEGQQFFWNLKEFEREMEVEYLFGLEFESKKVLEKIVSRCRKAKEREEISSQEIWFGSLYEKEILSGTVGSVFLRWIDPQIGLGLFASSDLPKGTYIGEYAGQVRPFSERKDRKNCYCFEYKTDRFGKTPYTIDARDKGNLVRFINHSSSCNLTPHLVFCQEVMHVILITNQPVAKGSELTYDYGPTYWSKREKPLISKGES